MIRKAEGTDSEDFCRIVRTSIIELCGLDHQGDSARLEEWLENKTVENCERWIIDKDSNSFVAENDGEIVGVSHIGHNGHLYLCYVLPDVKGLGFGGQLLVAAEKSVSMLGLNKLTLESTITAQLFYEHYGYKHVGKTDNCLMYAKSI